MTAEITVSVTLPEVDIQPCAPQVESHLFEAIAQNLLTQGYSVHPGALPESLGDMLHDYVQRLPGGQFDPAGIGRDEQHTLVKTIRKDEICWITGDTPATKAWLDWTAELQAYLNRRLFLGLFSFESHFAHYAPGDFYKRHVDAFRGDTNRILSVVIYLNRDWRDENGGELILYQDREDTTGQKIKPSFGTIVTFLSEEFPHEVLPARSDRYSIAGWFRVNSTSTERVDPPN
ncbi:2OG-Fe(II) oxygenase [Aestuariicella sp. G3-2]|uniref:2OG-Fe(II) oxygenase n=1 Tax=Pseudomaricurvus albidus TaxID=2842452 RepID=UPI001C0D0377|nr:2OG-Fe(II) oxygenase [Aestuariicella albida]MBU3069374.1 2OG-Fe(II) oxygenase [Aestuariicella albida]